MRTILRLLVIAWAAGLILPTASATPATQIVAELGQMGPYEVGYVEYMLIDPARDADSGFGGRPIPVALWYPVDRGDTSGALEALYTFDPYDPSSPLIPSSRFEADAGLDPAFRDVPVSLDAPFPLVVFSPGLGATSLFHISVGTRLASHGFVVAIPSHFGDAATPSDDFVHVAMASLNRTVDIPYVLDDLLNRNQDSTDPLFDLVRPDQIAAAGWSLGGYAAMALAGGDDVVADRLNFPFGGLDPPAEAWAPAVPDDRIKVIVTLEGSNQVLGFNELARITVPALGMGRDWGSLAAAGMSPDWQARQHAAIQGHPSYRVDLLNAHHVTFSDRCVTHPILKDLGLMDPGYAEWFQQTYCDPFIPFSVADPLVKRYMLAFLKTQLVGDSGYQNMLTPGWANAREPDIQFFETEKKNPNAIDEDWPDISIYFQYQPGY